MVYQTEDKNEKYFQEEFREGEKLNQRDKKQIKGTEDKDLTTGTELMLI